MGKGCFHLHEGLFFRGGPTAFFDRARDLCTASGSRRFATDAQLCLARAVLDLTGLGLMYRCLRPRGHDPYSFGRTCLAMPSRLLFPWLDAVDPAHAMVQQRIGCVVN